MPDGAALFSQLGGFVAIISHEIDVGLKGKKAMTAVLSITKLGETEIKFSFESGRRKPFSSSTQEVWVVPVEPSALLNFCREMNSAAESANKNPGAPDAAVALFVKAGRGLFRELLPKTNPRIRELLAKLRKLKSPLLISTDEPNLFWELLYDEEQHSFLGMKHRVGRRLMTQEVPTNMLRIRQDWRCLMIADPTGNLPQTAREAAQLRDWLKERNFKDIDYLPGREANFNSVLAALSSRQYDIIHYAGHTAVDPKTGEYALELHKKELFRASLIRRHLNGSPIVFLNGCWTGYAKGLENTPGSVVGLTDAFLAAGAQVVVGSQFEVPDAGARAFAEKFYESLLAGECVGEAMRAARQQVQKAPGCAAAWACFVLYGDPAVQLHLRKDPLGDLLATIGLGREHLDAPSLRVVQQALDYSGKSNLVATIELFAALVDSDSGFLRKGLEEQGVPVEKVARAFKSVLKKINASGSSPPQGKKKGGACFSDNTAAILRGAQVAAQADGLPRILERALVHAFVRKQGGSTGKTLRAIGLDFERLLKWITDVTPAEKPGVEVAPDPKPHGERDVPQLTLSKGEFTREAWQVITHSCELASHSKAHLVGTKQLFLSLQRNPDGPLARALRRLNLAPQLTRQRVENNGSGNSPPVSVPASETLPLSANVRAVLQSARELALKESRSQITEWDLLRAFVRLGGGSVGNSLRKQLQLMPDALASELFLPSDDFDLKKFAPELHSPLRQAKQLASARGHRMVGRHHLLCAMLAEAKSLFSNVLREQGKDARGVEHTIASVQPAATPAGTINEVTGSISINLANVLATAENEMRTLGLKQIGEAPLLLALLNQSPEVCDRLVQQQGINLKLLIQAVQVRVNPVGWTN